MTSGIALVLALSLFVNNMTLLCDTDFTFLRDEHMAATFVFLFSVCLTLSELTFLPTALLKKYPLIFCLLEVPVSLFLIESSLYYVWGSVQDAVCHRADDMMMFLSRDMHLDWLLCHLCQGSDNCTETFTALFLKLVSFGALLLTTVAYCYLV